MYRSAIFFIIVFAASASHGQMAKAPDPTACLGLAKDFDLAEKELARLSTEGIGDNSAPRESLRSQKSANELSKAGMAIDLMRAHNCPLPRRAASAAAYLGSALDCQKMVIAGRFDAAECRFENWRRATLAE